MSRYAYAKIVNDEVLEWPLSDLNILKRHNLLYNSAIGDKKSRENICVELGYTKIDIRRLKAIEESHNHMPIAELYKDENDIWQIRLVLQKLDENSDIYKARLNTKWDFIRNKRNELLKETDFRVMSAMSGKNPDEDLNALESYRQQLANITNQEDPFKIVWPNKV